MQKAQTRYTVERAREKPAKSLFKPVSFMLYLPSEASAWQSFRLTELLFGSKTSEKPHQRQSEVAVRRNVSALIYHHHVIKFVRLEVIFTVK